LFESLSGSKFRSLWDSTCLALYRRRLQGRRSGGRGVGGRIVVRTRPHYHIWCMCYWIYAPRMAYSPVLEKPQPRNVTCRSEVPQSMVHSPSSSLPPSRSHSAASALLPSDFWFLTSDFGRLR
jgi:hypothetical protein